MTPNIVAINFANDKTVNTKNPTIKRRTRLNLTPPKFLNLTTKATKPTTTRNTNRSTIKLSKLSQAATTNCGHWFGVSISFSMWQSCPAR